MSLNGKAYSTARTYIAGIATRHKLNSWPDPSATFLTQKVLQGLAKENPTTDNRLPITLPRLQQLIPVLPSVCTNTYEASLFKAAFTLAFFGFLRVSEIVGQGSRVAGGRTGLALGDVKLEGHIVMHLQGSKTDQMAKGTKIIIESTNHPTHVCPVEALKEFLSKRNNKPGNLFIHLDGKPLTRYQFQAVLKKAAGILGWDLARFSTHSFRIGAATTAAAKGMPLPTIMAKGRWRSAAIHKYVRPDH